MRVKSAFVCFSFAVAAAFFVAFAAQGATRVWTGGSGDWTDIANWLDGATPSAGDTVYVSNTVDNVTINIDASGVSIASIRFEGKGLVTLTGNALTLTAAWSFKLETTGVYNKMNYRTSTFSFLAYGSDVECRVPLVINDNGGVCTATNTVHFREKITIAKDKSMRIHNGLTPNNEDLAAGVPNASVSTPIYFHNEIVGENASILPTQAPCGDIYFYDAVKVYYINMNGSYTSPVVHLFSASNSFDQMSVEYSAMYYAEAAGAIPSNAVLYLCEPYSTGSKAWFNLGNHDAVINRLCDYNAAAMAKYGADTTRDIGCVKSTDSSSTSVAGNASPVTLTMKATADAVTSCRIQDKVSIVWDPSDEYTLTFTNRASNTQGDITVKRGRIRLVGAASFPNVQAVNVASGAKFEIATSVASPFSANTLVRLESGAKLVVPANVSVTVGILSVNGSFVADDTYTGTGEGAPDWLEGEGSVTVSTSSFCVWKEAVSGTWSDSANWLNGRVPDGTETGTFISCDSADDFTVSISSVLPAFPTNFSMSNTGGGRTTLSVGADVTANKSAFYIGEGARVKVESGAEFLHFSEMPPGYNYQSPASTPEYACTIEKGGEWIIDGGSTVFTNFCGTFDIQSSSRLALQGGNLVYCNRGSVFPLRIHTGGAVDLHDGNFYFPHHGYNYNRDINLLGGSLVLSNMTSASGGTFATGTGGGLIFGSGETVFAGNSNIPDINRGSIYLVAKDEGETAHLTMKDTAYFPDSHANRHFMMGSTSGGKALFDYEAGVSFPSKALRMTVGNLLGEAEFNVKAGTFKVASEGFAVAIVVAAGNDSVFKYSQATGVVAKATVAAGASMPITGSLDAGWGANKRICGISVGYGNAEVTPGRRIEGEMHVAGAVTNDAGCTVIGAGTGTGLYVQDGGETHLEQCASWGLHAVTAIGLMGGKGTLVVSNGTFKIAQSKLFVGGCLPSEILSYANAAPHGQVAWTAEGLPADAHDAQGKVVVAGGTLSAAGDVIVGSDGAGEIEMDGTSGTFTAGNLVLSNATSSVVRFVAGAAGFSPVNVTGKLAVTDGTRIEVDLSDYTGSAKKHRLFTAGSFEGNFDNVELVVRDGNGEVHKPFSLNKSATTLDLCFISGTAILFR